MCANNLLAHGARACQRPPPPPRRHLCLTVECITSGLHLSVFLIRSHPPPPPVHHQCLCANRFGAYANPPNPGTNKLLARTDPETTSYSEVTQHGLQASETPTAWAGRATYGTRARDPSVSKPSGAVLGLHARVPEDPDLFRQHSAGAQCLRVNVYHPFKYILRVV